MSYIPSILSRAFWSASVFDCLGRAAAVDLEGGRAVGLEVGATVVEGCSCCAASNTTACA